MASVLLADAEEDGVEDGGDEKREDGGEGEAEHDGHGHRGEKRIGDQWDHAKHSGEHDRADRTQIARAGVEDGSAGACAFGDGIANLLTTTIWFLIISPRRASRPSRAKQGGVKQRKFKVEG